MNEPMANYLELSFAQVAWVASLILINAGLSLALRLRLERSLLMASVRTIVQLALIGLVLEWIFEQTHWYWVILLATLMTIVAGVTAASRTQRRYQGMWLDSLISVWISSWLATAFTLQVIRHGEAAWLSPQYAIPLLGMVLGNALNGISVGLNTLTESFATRRAEIETQLALGATSYEAARPWIQNAVRSGMIPIINSMMVVGLVSLPGMMTGQLLSGVEPMEAVKYQMVIMFLIAAATAMGTGGIVLLGYRRFFNTRHQFLASRLYSKNLT
jgi:putative ABC transport system permease protein